MPLFLASTMQITFGLLLLLVFTSCAAAADEANRLRIANLHCKGTPYPSHCVSTLTANSTLPSEDNLPHDLAAAVNNTAGKAEASSQTSTHILDDPSRNLGTLEKNGLKDCVELQNATAGNLHTVASDISSPTTANQNPGDVQTLLSASLTNQRTCSDGFAYAPKSSTVRSEIQPQLNDISKDVKNYLSMGQQTFGGNASSAPAGADMEPFAGYGKVSRGGFPVWLTRRDRRLLQAPAKMTKPDLVVAKDGSGNFMTISEAVAAAPDNSKKRFVIHIKAGVYMENVEVNKMKTNLMFIGDGIGKTVVRANRNVVGGWTTFSSATVAVVGNGFVARDLTIENSASQSRYPAVALRSSSDHSAFYRCSFISHRNTLYAHSFRQFYRDCEVYGTVDFIFGDAAVVFQNCSLYARRPGPNQKNTITAQARQDPNQNTGISIQRCKVAAAADLIPVQSSVKTYLGRPWGQHSRTVFMQSFLGSLIAPAGWLEWSGNFALTTLYYGEYMNSGPGSNTANRVTWPGYRVITSPAEASKFTVANLIQGRQWLPATGIPFTPGL